MKLIFDEIKIGDINSVNLKLPRISCVAKKPGPKIVLLAAQHGNEVSPLFLLRRWLINLCQQQLNCGSLVILPVVNPRGLAWRKRVEPLSGKDINRQYPGSQADFAGKIAAAVVGESSDASLVIDLHNFTTRQSCFMGVLIKADQAVETKVRQALKLIQPDLVWQIDVSQKQDREQQGALDVFLNQQGIPAGSLELPGQWYLQDSELIRIEKGLQKLLSFYGLLSQSSDREDKNNLVVPVYSAFPLLASNDGLFWPLKKVLDQVKPDDELGILTELPGFIDRSVSGLTGTVLTLGYPSLVKAGSKLATIGRRIGSLF